MPPAVADALEQIPRPLIRLILRATVAGMIDVLDALEDDPHAEPDADGEAEQDACPAADDAGTPVAESEPRRTVIPTQGGH